MINLVLAIYNLFSKRKFLLLALLTILILILGFAASRINFKEDISSFLPKGKDTQRINYAMQHINSVNKLVISVKMADTTSSPNQDLIIEAMSHFAEYLQQTDSNQHYLKKIEYIVNQEQILALYGFLVQNMPYFLSEEDYERLDTLLTEENIRLQMRNNKRMLMTPIGMVMKQNIMSDPLHFAALLISGLQNFQLSDRFQLHNDHIFTNNKTEGILFIESMFSMSESKGNASLLRLIDDAIANTQSTFEQLILIHYFGSIDIAVTNANRIKKDTLFSSLIAIILILSILIYAMRSTRNILVMFGSLAFGWLFALGLLSVLKDDVSLIAVGISSIIIGIAVNYPLHFILHHRHESRIPTVIKNIVIPLTIGNITTVGAFLSLIFISSDAMHDLGLFASLLLVGVICFVLIFLPHLLRKNSNASNIEMEQVLVFGKLLSRKPKRKRWLALFFIVLTVVFFAFSFDTKFDTNMQNINYMTHSQKEDVKKMFSLLDQGQKTIYYVSEGDSMDEALATFDSSKMTLDSLQSVEILTNVKGLGNYLPSKQKQQERLVRWKLFCETHKDILATIDKFGVENGFISGTFDPFAQIVNADYQIEELDFFSPLSSTFAENYIVNKPEKYLVMTVLQTKVEDLDKLEAELNAIHSNSFSFDTGTLNRNLITSLSNDFDFILLICGIIVFLFLTITLGRIELSILAFLPLTIGWFWILGIMNICDIHFNIINIILASFIFGMGDDYTIFITEGLMYEHSYKRKILITYKNSIILSALIMFIGIGALIFAKHPALRSLAEIIMVGMFSVVLMAFLLPPVIFRMLTMKKGKRRLIPVTLVNFFSSVFLTSVFFLGSMFITVVGLFLFSIGKTTDKKKLLFHKLLCRAARFEVSCIPRVKTTYNISDKTIFNKPAVMICNHQSHLDLMFVLSLTPKLILLTNAWVWNSPVFGRLVKYADFYPVSNGIENALDKLQTAVEKGYSIMVFPEGTRSEDCSIKRFHQGAFYLAEKLKLDIIPVLIHGVGHFLPKSEFMLRKGKLHIQVMNRVSFNDCTFGESYQERAKLIRKFYLKEYEKIATAIETPDYFSDLVIHNYIYKGPLIERTVRRNLKKNGNYRELINSLAGKNRILIIGCGYGELPLLLSLVHKKTEVVAIEREPDLLDLAANCRSVPANLQYFATIDEEEMEEFEVVVQLNSLSQPIVLTQNLQDKNH
ncbi:MAG: 1-acyl-sn-glycerol-3-phosphate acyltransferase [Bacteroidales bacterium]|jgi:1-acyl-sn-glycerol-3-phosphate acyltransferase|nr:1-acyl-sn-glycerol-3-phosphate acyltransferase [Bacteroidales bacterium]